jgi:hypothetical protein
LSRRFSTAKTLRSSDRVWNGTTLQVLCGWLTSILCLSNDHHAHRVVSVDLDNKAQSKMGVPNFADR